MDSAILAPALAMLIVALVLVFAFSNGFNDSAPIVAAVISSGAMSPRNALLAAAVFDFAGAYLLGTAVATMVGTGIVDPRIVSPQVILAAVIAAISWNVLAWYRAVPTSSSHALVGGLIGAALVGGGPDSVQWINVLKIYQVLILTPLLGFAVAFVVTRILLAALKQARPTTANGIFLRLQPLSALGLAMSHGSVAAQTGMGLISVGLFLLVPLAPEILAPVYGPGDPGEFRIPHWVIVCCSIAIALGMATGGWRIIRTLGGGLYRIRPIHGFTSQVSSAAIIYASSVAGYPVSPSQIASSSIIGAGAAQRMNAVRWSPVKHMAAAWVITIPSAAALSALVITTASWAIPRLGL
jgi:PiT family inorganic phosphate transporter